MPGECFSSLVQAVTSQAETCEHLKGESIEGLLGQLLEFNVFRIDEVNLLYKKYSIHDKFKTLELWL